MSILRNAEEEELFFAAFLDEVIELLESTTIVELYLADQGAKETLHFEYGARLLLKMEQLKDEVLNAGGNCSLRQFV